MGNLDTNNWIAIMKLLINKMIRNQVMNMKVKIMSMKTKVIIIKGKINLQLVKMIKVRVINIFGLVIPF